MYQINYRDFEGPLDLLLGLIEKNKLDITQLSLAKVADDYLAYIEENGNIDIANLSQFLLTASHLILLKSKALLPLFEFTKEEEEEIEDLEIRLREYQKFKTLAGEIRKLLERKKIFFSKNEENLDYKKFVPIDCKMEKLEEIFRKVIQNIPAKQNLKEEIMEEIMTLEDKILEIKNTLQERVQVAFKETIRNTGDKIELIVSFLAMLEMIKQKIIFVSQEKTFADISISKRNN